jgi:hypothetical protein
MHYCEMAVHVVCCCDCAGGPGRAHYQSAGAITEDDSERGMVQCIIRAIAMTQILSVDMCSSCSDVVA